MQNQWLLAGVIGCVLYSDAIDARSKDSEEKKVQVTGSLIKKADQSGPSPIISISADDLAQLGHLTLYDALISLTSQTGALAEGDQFPNGFTSAAQALNLRGFGPGRTLVLVNGQRLALNPTPYQSESNFFNFATIPTIAIDRIDVLTDGASSIYGSDAIAGVINIVLRDDFENNEIALTIGGTREGGGETIKLTGGNSFYSSDALFTVGFEWENRRPIYGKDRDWLDDYQGVIQSTAEHFDFETYQYVLPSPDVCNDHPDWTLGNGNYCGRNRVGDETLRNLRERFSIFAHGERTVRNGKWFADFIYWQSETEARNFRLFWYDYYLGNDGSDGWDGRDIQYLFRTLSPFETGDQDQVFDESSVSFITGFDGFTQDYDYQVQLTRSEYKHNRKVPRIHEESAREFFIDPVGYFYGFPVMGSPQSSIFDVLNPEQLSGIIGKGIADADSISTTLSYWMSGESWSFLKTPSEYALVVEWNDTEYDVTVDKTSANFEWFGTGGSSGGGERDRLAVGLEWLVPVVRNDSIGDVDLTLATRWDDYRDSTSVGNAQTWKVALEWDASESLSLRASKSSSFRAPDLHYLYADLSIYYTNVYDIELCVNRDNLSYEDCMTNGNYADEILVGWQGTRQLEEEEGRTNTFGLIYQPNKNLALTVDFYDIKLSNQVGLQLESQYLLWEAQCNAGTNFVTGESVDVNSELCQDALSRVVRFSNNILDYIVNTPVNRAFRRQKGVDLAFNTFYNSDEYGRFGFDFKYSHIFETRIQEIASEPSTDYPNFRDSPLNTDLRTRANATFSWGRGDWTSALSIYRKGSLIKADGSGRISPWNTINYMVEKQLAENDRLRLTIRNITNAKPPKDSSFTSWPYFNRGQYNAIGMEWLLEYKLTY